MNKKNYLKLILACVFAALSNQSALSINISGGTAYAVYLCDSAVYAWGVDSTHYYDGLLALDKTTSGYKTERYKTESEQYYKSPQLVDTKGIKFKQIDAGSGYSTAGISDNGVVYVWGKNTITSEPLVIGVTPVPCGEAAGYNEDGTEGGSYLGNVKMVVGSTSGFLALLQNGEVVYFGLSIPSTLFIANKNPLPTFIVKEDGSKLTDVVYLAGSDDHFLMLTSDGLAYSYGLYDGRSSSTETLTSYAAPVLYGDSQTPITGVVSVGCADVASMLATKHGYVYSWGNGGWGDATGQGTSRSSNKPNMIRTSGDYRRISGRDELTNVRKVDGGRAYGLALTYDGYVLYFGNNDGNGGVIGNDFTGTNTIKTGPQFLIYEDSSIVNDAVDIRCGDNFGFVVNSKNEYYAFGLNSNGQCGINSDSAQIHRLTKMDLPCQPKPLCASVAIIEDTIYVCDSGDEIYANITATDDSDYTVTWTGIGQAKSNSSFFTSVEGLKKITLINSDSECPVSSDSVYVKVLEKSVEGVPTRMTFPDIDKLTSADSLVFRVIAKNVDKVVFYQDYSEDNPLDTITCTADTVAAKFSVADLTLYPTSDSTKMSLLWTKGLQQTSLLPSVDEISGASELTNLFFKSDDEVVLSAFHFYAKSFIYDLDITVRPVLFSVIYNVSTGYYSISDTLWIGDYQTVGISDSYTDVKINCGVKLQADKVYAIGIQFSSGIYCSLGHNTLNLDDGSIEDEKGLGIYIIASNQNGISNANNLFFNLEFDKDPTPYCNYLLATATEAKNEKTVTGVDEVSAQMSAPVDVYNANGILVKKDVPYSAALRGLPIGVYIINGEKVIKTSQDR